MMDGQARDDGVDVARSPALDGKLVATVQRYTVL
jgi:hypothetical protein